MPKKKEPVAETPVKVVAKPTPKPKAATKPKPKAPTKAKAPVKPKAKPRSAAKPKGGLGQKIPEAIIQDATPEAVGDTMADALLEGLTVMEIAFVEKYLCSFNGTQAYKDAGFTVANDNVAAACSSKLLRSAKVGKYVAKRIKDMFERAKGEAVQDRLLRTLLDILAADPNELCEYRRSCCRHCYGGESFEYQLTPSELKRKKDHHEKRRNDLIDQDKPDIGEFPEYTLGWYDKRKEPNNDCPDCAGEGLGEVILKDTRNLSPAANALYAGVKEGRDGIEVKMLSKEKAMEMLSKILKLYEDKIEVNMTAPDSAYLDSIYTNAMAKMQEMKDQVAGRGERVGK